MAYSLIEQRTKQIRIEQHKAYIRDRSILRSLLQSGRAAVDLRRWGRVLSRKTILDVGCGNTAYFQKAMVDLGAAHITCLDIGEDWIPELTAALMSSVCHARNIPACPVPPPHCHSPMRPSTW